jgi:thioredoxin 1
MAHEITDATFDQEVLKADVPVLVDFWAPWCGPCRTLGPIVEELAKDNEGKPVKIVKINVDENQEFPSKYGVMSIPTLIFFKGGQPAEQMVGVQDKATLQAKLDELAG